MRPTARRLRKCIICNGPIYRVTAGSDQCSQSCYEKWKRDSGKPATIRYSSLPAVVARTRYDRNLSTLGRGDRDRLVAYLTERDGNRCQIPSCIYRSRKMGIGDRRPSLDHIIPLSRGGENELANIQLAHYRCNLIKSNRAVGDQLALIG